MEYREAMFFGLDFRQMACSLLAVLAAVGIYFSLRGVAGDEITGWLCMAGAAPFAFCGFFKYHGMTAEQFAWAFIKSEFLYPKKLVFRPEDIYYQCMEERLSGGDSRKKEKAEQEKKKRDQATVEKNGRINRNNGKQKPLKKKRRNHGRMGLANGRRETQVSRSDSIRKERQNCRDGRMQKASLNSRQRSGSLKRDGSDIMRQEPRKNVTANRQSNQQISRTVNRQNNQQNSRSDGRRAERQKGNPDSRQRKRRGAND